MEELKDPVRFLWISTRMILLSILLMIIIIPAVFTRSLPDAYNPGAVIGISLAMIIRLLIFFRIKSLIKKLRLGETLKKSAYIIPGILLILFALFYSDGAFAFLDNENIPYVSFIMFGSIFCDLMAAIFTFTVNLLRT